MTTTTEELLSALDPDQRRAATAPPTPLLIFAGAGGGKTATIARRIGYQLLEGIATPDSCMTACFTKAASKEMHDRIGGLIGEDLSPTVKTFHSHMLAILRQDRERKTLPRFEICDSAETTRTIRDICGPVSRDWPSALNLDVDIARVTGIIGMWKNALIFHDDEEISQTAEEAPRGTDMHAAALAYPLYQNHLAAVNKLDFDDMLLYGWELLQTDEQARAFWQQRWNAFFIDEGQDYNKAQFAIMELLAPPANEPNITIVGDSRQAIYRWRGAEPELFDGFTIRYPNAQRVDLTRNYRSTPQVIAHANKLVSSFDLPDQTHVRDEGTSAVVAYFDTQTEQAIEIARLVSEVRAKHRPGGDVAVILRTNAQGAQLERAFVAAGLPYWVKQGGFFDRMEVGDLVAYMRLAHDRTNYDALRRIINRPTRYLGAAFVDACALEAKKVEGDLVAALTRVVATRGKALSKKQRDSAADLQALLQHIGPGPDGNAMHPMLAITRILEWTEYIDWLKKNTGSDASADESREENLDALRSVAAQAGTVKDFLDFIDETKRLQIETRDATQIMTTHAAKGQEFPVVIVSNFHEGSFPHVKAMTEFRGLEDEMRVAYVAMTRAQDLLVLAVPAEDTKSKPVDPSQFLHMAGFELPDEDPDVIEDHWWGKALESI